MNPKKLGPKRYKVRSERNSACIRDLDSLDWSNWFVDLSFGRFYLHVDALDGDTVWRVRCRKAMMPRLAMKNGDLYWLVDGETAVIA